MVLASVKYETVWFASQLRNEQFCFVLFLFCLFINPEHLRGMRSARVYLFLLFFLCFLSLPSFSLLPSDPHCCFLSSGAICQFFRAQIFHVVIVIVYFSPKAFDTLPRKVDDCGDINEWLSIFIYQNNLIIITI